MNYLSWVDCDHPDFDRFPEFREATALEAMLSPGEIDLAISVNFWCEP